MRRPCGAWRGVLAVLVAALAGEPALADHLEVRRAATLKAAPEREAAIVARPEVGERLPLLNDGTQTDGYYFARRPADGRTGWIYRTLVRRHPGPVPLDPGGGEVSAGTGLAVDPDTGLLVCSFNIQFLGLSTRRDAAGLASVLDPCDIAVVQELIAPPFEGTFPDGMPFRPDAEAAAFFEEMAALGFAFVLSEEDTGTGARNHLNSTATEWWGSFFRPERVGIADDLPRGFLAEDRTDHPDYERVPYAVGFRSAEASLDFVLISVHLQPNPGPAKRRRRQKELAAIAAWVEAQPGSEGDYIILGDMNIQNCRELTDATPVGFVSLNGQCRQTNTNTRPGSERSYDHVMYRPAATAREIDFAFGFHVIDLIEEMRDDWEIHNDGSTYPGDPYDYNRFRAFYSDHHPVAFRMLFQMEGDDD